MIILDSADKSLEVKLAGAVTTTELAIVASYVDMSDPTTYTPGENDLATNGATAVTAVAAPAADHQRQLKLLTVYNLDTVAATVTVQVNNDGTKRVLISCTLGVGETLQYVDGHGFVVIDASGFLKRSSGLTHSYVGYNAAGGSTEIMTTNRWYCKKFTMSKSGLLVAGEAYVENQGDYVGGWSMAVFADNAGSPGILISFAGLNTNPGYDMDLYNGAAALPRWLARPLAKYLVTGDYWIGVCTTSTGDNRNILHYDGSGSDQYFDSAGAWVADGGRYTLVPTTNRYSIRASILS